METEITYAASAERDLDRLDAQVARRVLAAVHRYAATGGGNVRRLTGAGGASRLRVGDWRVRFRDRIEERQATAPTTGTVRVRVIEVVRVLHRSVAYDDL
jgi:mRNA interferase RelE/StbE